MKKKLLLIITFVAIMVCAFAISVSAVSIDGIDYSFSGTNATVTSANQSCELTNVVIPSTVTYENVEYTVTAIDNNAFGNSNSSKANKIVQSVYIPDTVVSIGEHAFREMTSLQSVRISPNVAELINACFMNSSIKTVTFGDGSKLTSLGEHIFRGCKSLQAISLPNGLITIDNYVFRDSGLTEIVIPNSVTTIGDYAFQNCSNLTSVVLSNKLVSLGSNNFQSTKVTEIVFPSTLVTVKNHVFHGSALAKITIGAKDISGYDKSFLEKSKINLVLFAGDEASVETLKTFTNLTDVVDVITYEKHLENEKDSSFSGYTSKTIVYGINVCEEVNDGVHVVEEINACVGECSLCENSIIKHNSEFEYEIVEYENGYDNVGMYARKCKNTGCQYQEKISDTEALFTSLGYSVSEDSDDRLTMGYTIDQDAIDFYNEKTSSTLSYGMYVVLYDTLGKNDILDENEAPSEGVLKINMSDTNYRNVSVKITGIKTEAQKETKLLIGVYVVNNNGEIKEIIYLNQGLKDEGDKYSYVTYNYVKENFQ